MNDNNSIDTDRRVESRALPDQIHSVQFTKQGLDMTYQFKIRNISTKGMCILVRQGSQVISHLKVGDILDMKYYPEEGKGAIDQSKTEIIHISKGKPGWFEGHCLVGLSILKT
jgi:hypothetical protein